MEPELLLHYWQGNKGSQSLLIIILLVSMLQDYFQTEINEQSLLFREKDDTGIYNPSTR